VTPKDINYSYRATERLIYEYTAYLSSHSITSTVLIPDYYLTIKNGSKAKLINDKYRKVKTKFIHGIKLSLPFKFDMYFYLNLPSNGFVYLPYSLYNHIINLFLARKNSKFIIGSHSMHIKNGLLLPEHALLENLFKKFLQLFLTNTNIMRNLYFHALTQEQVLYLEQLKIPRKHIFLVPNFIDTKQFHIGINKIKKLRVLHVGGASKRADVVLLIIENLIRKRILSNFEFYFIGEMPSFFSTKKFSNIHYLGKISDKKKISVLSKMDVILLPASEVFPLTLLEGMASGLMVISANNSISRELRKLHANIIINTSGTIENYSNILFNLYKSKRKHGFPYIFKLQNRDIVIENFSSLKILPKFQEVIHNIIN
jgi:glycosyltransferase involved in cell wall biosynthesis